MWRHADLVNWTDVSEERVASIFRVEKSASEEPDWVCYHLLRLVSRSRIFLPWKWWRHITPKRRLNSQDLQGVHIAEDGILHNHRCENLKSYILQKISV
jgi:hypothetical protein